MQSSENISGNHHAEDYYDGHITGEASLCKFFIKGLCNRGSQCLYSHSLQAKKPVCKFFFSLQVYLVSDLTSPHMFYLLSSNSN